MSLSYEQEMAFLHNIRSTIEQYPDLLDKAVSACTYGMKKALETETMRAIDMELVAVGFEAMSTNKRYSDKNYHWASGLVASKLKKWPEHSRINWGKSIEDLEALNS